MRFIVVLLALFMTGCAKNYNNEVAIYEAVDNGYRITVKGLRGNMAHDSISLIFRGSSEVSEVINVPRISGFVRGNEIPTANGHYKYLGFIRFVDGKMLIDLQYDAYDRGTTPDSWWNGSYILKQAE
ncbi:hypothetical protein [Pseudoalteromonas sp. GB56]